MLTPRKDASAPAADDAGQGGVAGGGPPLQTPAGPPPAPALPDPLDPASQEHHPNLAYFAIRVGGEDGKAVGLFRVADDESAQSLTLERFAPSGEWEDDPALIDELHEPGCYSVDEGEAQTIQAQILAATQ